MNKEYDLVVIGSGPAGHRAAIQGAKLGKSVAIVEKSDQLGGAALRAGTVPTKAVREAVLNLTGTAKRGLLGKHCNLRRDVTIDELVSVTDGVLNNQQIVFRDSLQRNRVDILWGPARFKDEHELVIESSEGPTNVRASYIVIAVGTRPAKPDSVPFDHDTVITTDELRNLDRLPRSAIVVGGGVIGTELACFLATLGISTTIIEGRSCLLGFVDHEIIEAFQTALRRERVTLRLNEQVQKIEHVSADGAKMVQVTLDSQKKLQAEKLLYAIGRQGQAESLALDRIGIEADQRGRLIVNEHYQTSVDHIYAVGDIIGFPALAATGMEQGRVAACHAFGKNANSLPHLLPYGIYSIPEISMVGKTEEQLMADGTPYETGVAHWRDLARGQLLGDEIGMLKLLIDPVERTILGVHCLGTGATELIHIGQMAMAFSASVDALVDNVFNYPTLAEAYKVAAHNALNRLSTG